MLTPKQLQLIEVLADPADTRTKEEKAAEVGYSEGSVYHNQRDPEFLQALHKRTTELLGSSRHEALQCLVRQFRKGNVSAAKAYLEVTKDIQTGLNIINTVNNGSEFADRLRAEQEAREVAYNRERALLADSE